MLSIGKRQVLREPVSPAVILVVHDEEVVARVVTRFLKHLGYAVLEVTSGEQARALVHRREPPVDLVLCDDALGTRGGMDGTALALAVLAECPGPQLIVVTGALPGPSGPLNHGRRIRVLRKPLDLDELQNLLRVMLPNLLPVEECGATDQLVEAPSPRLIAPFP